MENGRELLVKGTRFQQLGSLGSRAPSLNAISLANNSALFFPSCCKSVFLMLLPQVKTGSVYTLTCCVASFNQSLYSTCITRAPQIYTVMSSFIWIYIFCVHVCIGVGADAVTCIGRAGDNL